MNNLEEKVNKPWFCQLNILELEHKFKRIPRNKISRLLEKSRIIHIIKNKLALVELKIRDYHGKV
jgi:hypothetical protein